MDNLIQIDPNILFKKIKNQFLAAIIGIMILVIFGITYVTSLEISDYNKYLAIAAFVVIAILTAFMVIKLNSGTQQLKEFDEQNKKNTKNISYKLWSLILGFGEGCLESEVPNNKRMFLADALSQVIECEIDNLQNGEQLFKNILLEIKTSSDSEIKQRKKFSEVLKQQKTSK